MDQGSGSCEARILQTAALSARYYHQHVVVLIDVNQFELFINMFDFFFPHGVTTGQYIQMFFIFGCSSFKKEWKKMFFEDACRPDFPITPESSLGSKTFCQSQNYFLISFVVSSLKIVLFGIRNYFNKYMNGSRGYLNGSSLGISPTGTCRGGGT